MSLMSFCLKRNRPDQIIYYLLELMDMDIYLYMVHDIQMVTDIRPSRPPALPLPTRRTPMH